MRRRLGEGPANRTAVLAAVARCRADGYVTTIMSLAQTMQAGRIVNSGST